MCQADGKTRDELLAMTGPELRQLVLAGRTYADVTFTRTGPAGDRDTLIERTRLMSDASVIAIRVTTWTYYPSGAVQYITISDRDGANAEYGRVRITHYQDGRQPTVRQVVP